MYISCKVAMEPETGYIPNNPLFGITLDSSQECLDNCVGCISCQSSTIPGINSTDLDCEGCFDQNLSSLSSNQGNSQIGSYWNQDEMNTSFPGLPPLEPLEPLPSLFPFSSCGASYNFSAPPQTSLSYTVHPQLNNHHNTQSYYDSSPQNYATTSSAPPIYPSMSVNMSVTMHGYPSTESTVPLQCSQWNPNSSSSVNVLYPQLISSPHYSGGTTYCSFTADFRPNDFRSNQNAQQINSFNEHQKLSPVLSQRNYHQHSMSQLSPKTSEYISHDNSSKLIAFEEDEESNEDSNESKPNLCGICGKSYARPSTLKTHLRTHSGERPFRCNQCNKSFSQAANLTAHVRTHTGQKPFKCHICDRRFSQSSSVTTHMRTHSGERPYRCREKNCKKAFSDSSTLTKHLRIHSGEKPYECKLCCLRFSQSGNLNRHMRIHGTNGNIS